MNPEQQQAIEHGDGPLLILAGAGSGKTACVVARVAHLVQQRGVPPWEILAVTFTNKAAGEMRSRLRELLGAEQAEEMQIGTFHSTGARLLRRHGHVLGLRPNFQILDESDALKIVEGILTETGRDESATPREVLAAIDHAKTRGMPIEESAAVMDEAGEISVDAESLRDIYLRYQRRCADENCVDFNDLLLKTRDLLRHPTTGPDLRRRYAHVLVDEFQDTNAVQCELVRMLIDRTKNLTVVGDPDQCVYEWRHAEPRNILEFARDYRGAKTVVLERNYRSTPAILDVANRLIACNRDRYKKRLWTDLISGPEAGDDGKGYPVVVMQFDDDYGEAAFIARSIQRYVTSPAPAGARKRTYSDVAILYRTHAQSRVLEEALRRERIPARVIGGTSFFERAEIRDVIAYLRVLDNPAADSALGRVINRPTRGVGEATVTRLRSWARSESWSRAEHAAQGAAPKDLWGGSDPLSPTSEAPAVVVSLLDAARAGSAGDIEGVGGPARKGLGKLAELIDGLRDLLEEDHPIADLIVQIIDRTGMRAKLEADGSAESIGRLENLSELVSIATRAHAEDRAARDAERERALARAPKIGDGSDFDPDLLEVDGDAYQPPLSITSFLERIALVQSDEESAASDGSAVSLMTIHTAKGLEWPCVYAPGWEDGLLPSTRNRKATHAAESPGRLPGQSRQPMSTMALEHAAAETKRKQIEEERRLAYVAITRARERLTITHARTRRVWGEVRECTPSRFLSEIAEPKPGRAL